MFNRRSATNSPGNATNPPEEVIRRLPSGPKTVERSQSHRSQGASGNGRDVRKGQLRRAGQNSLKHFHTDTGLQQPAAPGQAAEKQPGRRAGHPEPARPSLPTRRSGHGRGKTLRGKRERAQGRQAESRRSETDQLECAPGKDSCGQAECRARPVPREWNGRRRGSLFRTRSITEARKPEEGTSCLFRRQNRSIVVSSVASGWFGRGPCWCDRVFPVQLSCLLSCFQCGRFHGRVLRRFQDAGSAGAKGRARQRRAFMVPSGRPMARAAAATSIS